MTIKQQAQILADALRAIVQAWPAHGTDVVNNMADAMAERAVRALQDAEIPMERPI